MNNQNRFPPGAPPGAPQGYPQAHPQQGQPQQGYAQPQGYPQQPGYPQQASHPQQPGYPPQSHVPQQPGAMGAPQQHAPAPAAAPQGNLIQIRSVAKAFTRGGETLRILDNLNLDVAAGSFEALMGPSGSGKSTLLNLIAGLDRPTSGSIEIGGHRIDSMSDAALAKWRAQNIGFVFQAYNLLPVLTAIENVELPLLLTNLSSSERRRRAQTALRVVGLEERMGHYPRMLSGGQEQRVSIARAIVNDPALIVADEPTGDLDRTSADHILGLLEKLNRELGKTIVMVTHDPLAAERASITRHLNKGALQ